MNISFRLALDYVIVDIGSKQHLRHIQNLIKHSTLRLVSKLHYSASDTAEVIAQSDGILISLKEMLKYLDMYAAITLHKSLIKQASALGKPVYVESYDEIHDLYTSFDLPDGYLSETKSANILHIAPHDIVVPSFIEPHHWLDEAMKMKGIHVLIAEVLTADIMQLITCRNPDTIIILSARSEENRCVALYRNVYLIDAEDVWSTACVFLLHNKLAAVEDHVMYVSKLNTALSIRGLS